MKRGENRISPEAIKTGREKGKRLVKMAIDTGGGACYNNANQISQLKDRGAVVKSSPGVRSLRDRCRCERGRCRRRTCKIRLGKRIRFV